MVRSTKNTEFMIFLCNSFRLISILFLFLFYATALPQFTPEDSVLAKTVFTRTFDKEIIFTYLNSGVPEKVIAGLLAVSNSNDTVFAKPVTEIKTKELSRLIFYTLGQLGFSYESEKYLLQQLQSNKLNQTEYKTAFINFCKIARDETIKEFIASLTPEQKLKLSPVGFYHAFSRGVNLPDFKEIIRSQLVYKPESPPISEVAFSLYRIGPDSSFILPLKELLRSPEIISDPEAMYFILINSRKLKCSLLNSKDFTLLMTTGDDVVKMAGIESYSFKDIKEVEELADYLNLLKAENRNIAITAAKGLKNLTLALELKDQIYDELIKILQSSSVSETIRGELFISLCTIFSDNLPELENYFSSLSDKYKDLSIRFFKGSLPRYLQNILERFPEFKLNRKLTAIETVISQKESYRNFYEALITDFIASEDAALSTICTESVDSLLYTVFRTKLLRNIMKSAKRELNNPDFLEAHQAFYQLGKKFDSSLQFALAELFQNSRINSIRNIISEKSTRDTSNYFELWYKAFTYKKAEIITSKGIIRIQLKPEIAPFSTGNFISLAQKKFFNNIYFHRVVPGFVIQSGDPGGTGWGGPGYDIISEYSDFPFTAGTVGMASAGRDTEGSQWFIMQTRHPHLDGRYSVFGVSDSESSGVIQKITQDDKVLEIKLLD